jgi:hypothetical protein
MTTILETAEQVKAADALFRWLAAGCWVRRFRCDLVRDYRRGLTEVELGEWVIGYDSDDNEIWTDLTVLVAYSQEERATNDYPGYPAEVEIIGTYNSDGWYIAVDEDEVYQELWKLAP